MTRKSTTIGTSLNEFLKEEGIFESTHAAALKTIMALNLAKIIKQANISVHQLAQKTHLSLDVIESVLESDKTDVSLDILNKIALALNKRVVIHFEQL